MYVCDLHVCKYMPCAYATYDFFQCWDVIPILDTPGLKGPRQHQLQRKRFLHVSSTYVFHVSIWCNFYVILSYLISIHHPLDKYVHSAFFPLKHLKLHLSASLQLWWLALLPPPRWLGDEWHDRSSVIPWRWTMVNHRCGNSMELDFQQNIPSGNLT